MLNKEMLLCGGNKWTHRITVGSGRYVMTPTYYGFRSGSFGSLTPNTVFGYPVTLLACYKNTYFTCTDSSGWNVEGLRLKITRLDTGATKTLSYNPDHGESAIGSGVLFSSGDKGKTIDLIIESA